MLISELMRRTGVSRDTIRHYEDMGLLHDAHMTRRENGYRDFNELAVERIDFVRKAQRSGFKLSEIVQVADAWQSNELDLAFKQEILRKRLKNIDEHIADLQDLREDILALLDEDTL
ncbi:MAG: MerR family transcriptional regulator [Chloroflexota bacterium]